MRFLRGGSSGHKVEEFEGKVCVYPFTGVTNGIVARFAITIECIHQVLLLTFLGHQMIETLELNHEWTGSIEMFCTI